MSHIPQPDDHGRQVARQVERANPSWVILWGPYSREFWAFPCLAVARGIVLHDADPDVLISQMERVEFEVNASRPADAGPDDDNLHRVFRAPQMPWRTCEQRGSNASSREPFTISLPGIPVSVRACRRFVQKSVGDCPRVDDLMLAVSELASNAIAWSASGRGGEFTLLVRTAPRWARIEVTDAGPAAAASAASNGWGLGIVAAVTDRTGTSISPSGARTAWAEVTWTVPAIRDRASGCQR